jgi:hypothetical protein
MSYRIGKQPCANYNPQMEMNEHAIWENVHECYRCKSNVSFCLNCMRDHHLDGYETCKPEARQ